MNIHPTSIVSKKAVLGLGVTVGPFTIIHDNVEIGRDTEIGSHCEIGVSNGLSGSEILKIGENSLIRSHSIFYEGSTFGAELVTGHRVTVREKTYAGINLQIGTLSDIQGHCRIGDYVRFHSNVHIGQASDIGSYVWIFPFVVLTNDPHPPSDVMQGVTIKDFSAIATMSVLLPGAVVEEGVLVGAHSNLKGVAKADSVYSGNPAVRICATSKIKLQDGSGDAAYPWKERFKRGYPTNISDQW